MNSPIALRTLAGRTALSLFAAGSLALMAGQAVAADQDTVPTARVRYGDLNLATDAGARALYQRIQAAARTVCPIVDLRDLARLVEAQACRREAIERAVNAVGSPKLASAHRAATRRG